MSGKIKVFVCDDHALYRKGVKAVFRNDPGIEVVGEAGNGREAIERIKLVHPDVVLMDILMPGMNGLEATRRIVQSSKGPKVLIMTMFAEDDLIVSCLEAGAAGYILKDAPSTQLIDAVKKTFKDGKYFSPAVPNEVEYVQTVHQKDSHDRLSSLELEILKLLAEGLSKREIAFSFRLRAETVEFLQDNLMRKVNVRDRTELVEYAIRAEILRVSPAELRGKHSGRKAA
jgi:DNA-binding NarL/FixJ family response regulator